MSRSGGAAPGGERGGGGGGDGGGAGSSSEGDLALCLLSEPLIERIAQPNASGWMYKRSSLGWYKYWFSLKGSQLLYFEKKTVWRGPLVGTVSLFRAKVTVPDPRKRPLEFEITDKSGKVHPLKTTSKLEMHYWLTLIASVRNLIPPPNPIALERITPESIINNIHTDKVPSHISVDHVLMVVHGIGTKEEILTKNAGSLLLSNREIMQKIFPDVDYTVEMLVVHWRESVLNLKTHEDLMRLVPAFTNGNNVLREFILNRLFDILFYTRERLRNFIWKEVCSQLNALYADFKKRHPEFNGLVSIFSHSLGSVIIYEILSQQQKVDHRMLRSEGILLDFEVRNLFAVGSPLGGYLALEANMGLNKIMPDTFPYGLYNIFHPNDPVAMRLEPVVDTVYASVPPVVIPYWWTMDKTQNAVKWLGAFLGKRMNQEKAKSERMKAEGNGAVGAEAKDDERAKLAPGGATSSSSDAAAASSDGESAAAAGDAGGSGQAVALKKGMRRWDFMLQVSTSIEEVSTAYSAMKAHTDYWTSCDAMLFLMSTMMRDTYADPSRLPRGHHNLMTFRHFRELMHGGSAPSRDPFAVPPLPGKSPPSTDEEMSVAQAVSEAMAELLSNVEQRLNADGGGGGGNSAFESSTDEELQLGTHSSRPAPSRSRRRIKRILSSKPWRRDDAEELPEDQDAADEREDVPAAVAAASPPHTADDAADAAAAAAALSAKASSEDMNGSGGWYNMLRWWNKAEGPTSQS